MGIFCLLCDPDSILDLLRNSVVADAPFQHFINSKEQNHQEYIKSREKALMSWSRIRPNDLLDNDQSPRGRGAAIVPLGTASLQGFCGLIRLASSQDEPCPSFGVSNTNPSPHFCRRRRGTVNIHACLSSCNIDCFPYLIFPEISWPYTVHPTGFACSFTSTTFLRTMLISPA